MTLITQHTDNCATHRGLSCNCPMGRTWATPSDIRGQIGTFVSTAHKYEDEFLEEFCKVLAATELVDCFMGSDRTRLTVRSANGTEIPTTISTGKFIAWCDTITEVNAIPGTNIA